MFCFKAPKANSLDLREEKWRMKNDEHDIASSTPSKAAWLVRVGRGALKVWLCGTPIDTRAYRRMHYWMLHAYIDHQMRQRLLLIAMWSIAVHGCFFYIRLDQDYYVLLMVTWYILVHGCFNLVFTPFFLFYPSTFIKKACSCFVPIFHRRRGAHQVPYQVQQRNEHSRR